MEDRNAQEPHIGVSKAANTGKTGIPAGLEQLLGTAGLSLQDLDRLGIDPAEINPATLAELAVEYLEADEVGLDTADFAGDEGVSDEGVSELDPAEATAKPHASQAEIEAMFAQTAAHLYASEGEQHPEGVDTTTEADSTSAHGAAADRDDHTNAASPADLEEALAIFGAGGVSLDETGLSLPLDIGGGDKDLTSDASDATSAPSAADLAALATIEAELDQRWGETDIDPSLERITTLLDLLGNPQQNYPVILVAGTNGKTSTVRMIEALLQAFHRRTGRFTSPHLQQVTERIAIDAQPIAPADYVRIYEEIKPFIAMADEISAKSNGPRLSKFEVLTAMAYAAFADAPVEVAVVEVGMGGRWDSTNVVNAEVAVITPIGLDHTDYLGDTIEAIAGEKAGIIKPRAHDDVLAPAENVVIIGPQESAALEVLSKEAINADAAVARSGMEFGVASVQVAVGGQTLSLQGLGGTYNEIFLPLAGPHQASNAATALAAVEAFFGASPGHSLDESRVQAGFAQVQSPGRLEKVRATPAVFVDAAHNPQGASALGKALDHDFDFARLVAVVAVLGDKDAAGILNAFEPHVQDVVISENTSPRALPAEELAEIAREIFGEERVYVEPYFPAAVEQAIELAEDGELQSGSGVIITGSVVTAGEGRTLFGKEPA